VAGDDGKGAFCVFEGGEGAVGDIEAEVGFPVVSVGAVAFKAFVGEDGADVEVIADVVGGFGVGVGLGCGCGAVVMQAGGKNEYASGDEGYYGGNATDGSRFV
jgi:hypothetical protein